MTLEAQVATLRAALEDSQSLLVAASIEPRERAELYEQIDANRAALAATAEPVCSHCDGTRREPFMGKTPCGACVLSPAPRDALSLAYDSGFAAGKMHHPPRDAEREALLAFGLRVLTECETQSAFCPSGCWNRITSLDLAALLPVRK